MSDLKQSSSDLGKYPTNTSTLPYGTNQMVSNGSKRDFIGPKSSESRAVNNMSINERKQRAPQSHVDSTFANKTVAKFDKTGGFIPNASNHMSGSIKRN